MSEEQSADEPVIELVEVLSNVDENQPQADLNAQAMDDNNGGTIFYGRDGQ